MTADPGVNDLVVENPHTLPAESVLTELGVGVSGLSTTHSAQRLLIAGHNRLPEAPHAGPLKRFLRQFNNLLILILIAAAGITALLGHTLDTVVILIVVLVNTVLGFVQEGKAEKAIAAIRDMLAPRATVIRDGEKQTVDAQALVPGDLVLLEAGDKVPADCRRQYPDCAGSGVDRRVSGCREINEPCGAGRSAWRSPLHGVQRHADQHRSRPWRGGRHRC